MLSGTSKCVRQDRRLRLGQGSAACMEVCGGKVIEVKVTK